MNRSLILKIVILLAVLVGGQGVFWFFKTSATKKHIMAIINSSNGGVSASKVSVAGFPLSQKISIDDLKFQADAVADKISLPNKYQIKIKHLEMVSSVFSNDFNASTIGQISMQDASGSAGYVQFKQDPSLNFSFADGRLQKLSYQDSGYKIVDEAKNTLYESGSSAVNFDSTMEGENKVRNKIKADFNDIEGIDIFASKKLMLLINPSAAVAITEENVSDQNKVAAAEVAVKDQVAAPDANTNIPATVIPVADPANPAAAPTAPSADVAAAVPAVVGSGVAKKSIHLEIEYVLASKSAEAKPNALPNVNVGNGNLELASVDIKNLEFASPLYKINISGGFNVDGSNTSSQITSCDVAVKIDKFDNILTYVKKAAATQNAATPAAPAVQAVVLAAPTAPAVVAPSEIGKLPDAAAASLPAAAVDNHSQANTDIAGAIADLAKKNVGTKDDVAVFQIKKAKDGEFAINDTTLADLEKIFPALTGTIINEDY